MSVTNGESEVKPEILKTLLVEETVYLVPEHFDDLAASILARKAVDLGATISTEVSEASLIIVNDVSPFWNIDTQRSLIEQSHSGSAQIRPYHWLSVCRHRRARVNLEDLPLESPIMVQDHTDHHPLKLWVSKNVERQAGETPMEAFQSVINDLESAGAIIVPKRAHADVLIVDPASNFYSTVLKEREDNQRDWQKLAERDWVDYCVTNKQLQLMTVRDEEEEGSTEAGGAAESAVDQDFDELDSMAEEDSPIRAGPGRPTYQPRVDFTPDDDEFLIRYLAFRFPHGAWLSRKTYQTMMSEQVRYPPAARHTSQSWHERFRKNSTFKKRVERMMRTGLDASLKTAAERAKAAEKQVAVESGDQGLSRRATSTEDAGPSASTSRRPVNEQPAVLVHESSVPPSGAAEHRVPPSKALVEDDPFTQTPEPEVATRNEGKQHEVGPVAAVDVVETTIQQTRVRTEPNTNEVPDDANASAGPSTHKDIRQDLVRERSTTADVPNSVTVSVAPPAANDEALEDPRPKKRRKRPSAIGDIPPQPASALWGHATSGRPETPSERRGSHDGRIPPGSTPLRQEIERSAEKRRRERHRALHGHGPSSRRLSKRAASPDKVYAYVNLPPPLPVAPRVEEVSPAPRAEMSPARRTSPRELTPAEREQSVIAGSKIVQDVAAQYRARVAILGKKFGVGIKEISAATSEVKRRNGGKSAVDWGVLEMVLQEQYGR